MTSAVLVLATALLVGGCAALLVRARERKHRVLRDELTATRSRLHAGLAHGAVALLAVSRDGQVRWYEGGSVGLDAGRAAILGRSAWDAFNDIPELAAALRSGLRGNRGVERILTSGVALEVSYAPRFDDGGTIVEVVALVRDVTREQLEVDRAERLADVRSRILSVMGYRLRGQLNSVLGAAELASTVAGPGNAWLPDVEAAGHRLYAFVDHLVDFLELDAGRMAPHPAPFSLRDLVEGVASRHRDRAAADGTVFVVRFPGHTPADLEGDGHRIRQALDLLLTVALGTNAGGQVILNVEVVPLEAGRARVAISVEDAGRGLTPQARARVFDAFDADSAFWATRSGSSGLELPLAQRLASMLGGTLEVESAPGAGTTLRLDMELPRTWLSRRDATARPAEREVGRLLLVDDDAQQRRIERALAEACGWSVVEAGHGAQALEVLAGDEAIDAVLTELHMPVRDGVTLVADVLERWPSMPIGVLTADARPASRQLALSAGATACAVKPVSTQAMRALLDELSRAALARSLPAPSVGDIVDHDALRRLVALDSVEGPLVAAELIEAFLAAAPLQLLALADALARHDIDAVTDIEASLAVSERLLGLPRLGAALAMLADARVDGGGIEAGDAVSLVAQEVEAARDALARDALPQYAPARHASAVAA